MLNREVEAEHTKVDEEYNKICPKHKIEKLKVVAIGYLDSSEEYKKGRVSSLFMIKLTLLWGKGACMASLGRHECDFCEGGYGTGERETSSSEKILIDKENGIKYVFPEMIFHYIDKHNFLPPKEFIEYVMRAK